MKVVPSAIALSLIGLMTLPASAGEVKLQIANGRVTLQARDASVREILAEWARVGQVKIDNADKIVGGPVTLDLQDVPESQALNTVLRSLSGYMASPRIAPAAQLSTYDRIFVMAAPRPAATSAYTAPPAQQPQYGFRGGQPGMMGNPSMVDDQDQPIGPPPTYPGAQVAPVVRGAYGAPGQQAQPGATIPTGQGQLPQGAPGTVSQTPQVPGQPGVATPGTGAPGTVTPQTIKKPGGPGGPGGPGDEGGER
jgi:hypothetical protein